MDNYLIHYGVKGQKWGVRNDKKDTKSHASTMNTVYVSQQATTHNNSGNSQNPNPATTWSPTVQAFLDNVNPNPFETTSAGHGASAFGNSVVDALVKVDADYVLHGSFIDDLRTAYDDHPIMFSLAGIDRETFNVLVDDIAGAIENRNKVLEAATALQNKPEPEENAPSRPVYPSKEEANEHKEERMENFKNSPEAKATMYKREHRDDMTLQKKQAEKQKEAAARRAQAMRHSAMYVIVTDDELYHHGIKGQKWYVRRFQNEDGTLTPEGKKRYAKEYQKQLNDLDKRKAAAAAQYMGASRLRDYTDRLYNKAASKGHEEKAKKLLAKLDVYNKHLNDIQDHYKDADKKTHELIDKLTKEGFNYKTTGARRSIYNKELAKDLKSKNSKNMINQYYYTYADSTGYKVAPSEKVANKKSWNDDKHKRDRGVTAVKRHYIII